VYIESLVEPGQLRSFICRDGLGEKGMDPTTFAAIIAAASTRDQWPCVAMTGCRKCQADLLSGLSRPWLARWSARVADAGCRPCRVDDTRCGLLSCLQ
jgi:hypothetical protein